MKRIATFFLSMFFLSSLSFAGSPIALYHLLVQEIMNKLPEEIRSNPEAQTYKASLEAAYQAAFQAYLRENPQLAQSPYQDFLAKRFRSLIHQYDLHNKDFVNRLNVLKSNLARHPGNAPSIQPQIDELMLQYSDHTYINSLSMQLSYPFQSDEELKTLKSELEKNETYFSKVEIARPASFDRLLRGVDNELSKTTNFPEALKDSVSALPSISHNAPEGDHPKVNPEPTIHAN